MLIDNRRPSVGIALGAHQYRGVPAGDPATHGVPDLALPPRKRGRKLNAWIEESVVYGADFDAHVGASDDSIRGSKSGHASDDRQGAKLRRHNDLVNAGEVVRQSQNVHRIPYTLVWRGIM